MDYTVKSFKQLNSTNSYAKEHLAQLEDKTVIVAETQTAGRGRFERKWISDVVGNLFCSFVLKPCELATPEVLSNLTQFLSVVLAETFEKYNVKADIKWPNDVLVDGKKIAGILAEASFGEGCFKGIVLGVGVNLNLKNSEIKVIDQPATALNLVLKEDINLQEFSEKLFNSFFDEYETFMLEGFQLIKKRYLQRCTFIGNEILIKNLDNKKQGIAHQINDDGSLLLKTINNSYETVRIGDLTCLKTN